MKFFPSLSVALLSASSVLSASLSTLTRRDTCVAQQGTKYQYQYDLKYGYFYDFCGGNALQFESGTVHTTGFYQNINDANGYQYCSKYHSNYAGAKVVDNAGNRYNVIDVWKSESESSYQWTTGEYSSTYQDKGKIKLVGNGPLGGGVYSVNAACTYHYSPSTGYSYVCDPNTFSVECPP